MANVADTQLSPFMVNRQVPVPLQGSPQPEKVDFQSASAVRVTGVPPVKRWEHPEEEPLAQAIPAGSLSTDPPPLPRRETVRMAEQGPAVNVVSLPVAVPAALVAVTRKW